MKEMKISIAAGAIIIIIMNVAACSTPSTGYKTEIPYRPDIKKDAREALVNLKLTGTSVSMSKEGPAELTSPLLPSLVLSGDLENSGTVERKFFISGLRHFDTWANGWTEGFLEASGILSFHREYLLWRCNLEDGIKAWGIRSGEIRYYDRYYRGGDGAGKVRARFDRVSEAVEYLRRRPEAPLFYSDMKRTTAYGGPMAPVVEAVFFTKRAAGQAAGFEAPSPEIPENLRPVVANGALFRDFEEAPGLWLTLYNLPYVAGRLIDGALFRFDE
jgi:hypothetical protein